MNCGAEYYMLPHDAVRAGAVRSVCGDAGSFEPPRSDLVCYCYNPFGAPVMNAVAARLAAHGERSGCRIIIIDIDPRHPEILNYRQVYGAGRPSC
jgi:hypothetical protein